MERDVMPADVVFVGAGPANLAAAFRLGQILEEKGQTDDFEIMVIEKGREVGDHSLSGAVMDPRGMEELFGSDWREKGCPVEAEVKSEKVFEFSETKAKGLPFVPPPMRNEGFFIVSRSEVVRWIKVQVEAQGTMVAEGYPAASALIEGEGLRGVRLVDRGHEKDGSEASSFEPGADVEAKITVLGEGTRGSVTKQVVETLNLHGRNPQVYGTGIKEVWDIPAGRVEKGTVYHSARWPLENHQYGGSWIYAMSDTRVSVGFVAGLDGGDPGYDPYELMQSWKKHPFVQQILEGGSIVKSGAKTIPEGGWWSRPRSSGAGFLILGDSASLLNIARLKGIHTAIKSGILAAEVIAEALIEDDCSAEKLGSYENALESSWIAEELKRVRNWRQIFALNGYKRGRIHAGIAWALGGKIFKDFLPIHEDHAAMKKGQAAAGRSFKADGELVFDKATFVYNSGAIHEENQPSHLLIADTEVCATRCREEYGNPCERFCPASVYEMVASDDGGKRMQINFSNCVHCKTCDIADPYELITWTVPEDNGGPRYLGL